MGRLHWLIALTLALAAPAHAVGLVADLSQSRVSITANFDGSQILVFGAVKRDRPIAATKPLAVIVTVSGPELPVLVRRKSRVFGIWINTTAVHVDAAPAFYAVATSAPLNSILSNTEDLRYKISIGHEIRSIGAPPTIMNSPRFTKALIRLRERSGLYRIRESSVRFLQQTLFRTNIALPANIVAGSYTAAIYLTRNQKVVGHYTTSIHVNKVGLERWLYALAHQRPLIYGLLSVAIAILAGWGAAAAFRYLRR